VNTSKPTFVTTGEFLRYVREELLDVTQTEFIARLGANVFTNLKAYQRTERDELGREILVDALKLAATIARQIGGSAIQVLEYIDIGEPITSPPMRLSDLNPRPLVKEYPASDFRINEAINSAIEGRRKYFEGKIGIALQHYERAASLAHSRRQFILEAYIKVFLGNCQEMRGQIAAARKTLDEAIEIVDDQLPNTSDAETRRVLQVIQLRAEVNLVWVKWAIGMHQSAIQDVGVSLGNDQDIDREPAPALSIRAGELRDYYSHARIYGVLARSFMSLGLGKAAKYYAHHSLTYAYVFEIPYYKQTALFLDYPIDHAQGWRIDQQACVMIDILIANGEPEKAFEYYREIRYHRDPASHFNLHNWFDPAWQATLAKMRAEGKLNGEDLKPDIKYDLWENGVKAGGDLHIRALLKRSYASLQRYNRNLDHAQTLLDEAMITAEGIEANYTFVVCGLDACEVALEQGKLDIACEKLDMIQKTLAIIDNFYLDEKFAAARRTVENAQKSNFP
jgi:tetratricopeptide (TPR) repeat protein